MYNATPEPISTVYFFNPSNQSLCPYVARQRLCKRLSPRRIHATTEEPLSAFPIMCVSLCIPLSLLGNKTFMRQRSITWGVALHTVRVVSKETRRLIHIQTFFFFFSRFGTQAPKSAIRKALNTNKFNLDVRSNFHRLVWIIEIWARKS
jgi:hypothetical protein